ncbi:MAG: AgmX/PglI C-terminal domain-containing protein [Polyangiaceae bacterium]|nr:AgmX/PglI C-terminal domain-containing protein [Polyangiaceae bacterium]
MKTTKESPLSALVTIRWGDSVIASQRLKMGESANVGAAHGATALIPCDELGVKSALVARVREQGPVAVIPSGTWGSRERSRSFPTVIQGPCEVPLSSGELVTFGIGAFSITVSACTDEQGSWVGATPWYSALLPYRHTAVVAAAHALFIGLSAQAAHAAAFEKSDNYDDAKSYLASADERSRAVEQVVASDGDRNSGQDVNDNDGNGKPGGGEAAQGINGLMGASQSRQIQKTRVAVSGGKSGIQPLTREEAIADARSFGMIGVLAANRRDSNVSRFVKSAEALGPDDFSAMARLYGSDVGEASGAGGLQLSGVGEGGGGNGKGIGLGTMGMFGHTFGPEGWGTGGGGAPSIGTIGWGGHWGGNWSTGVGIGIGRIGKVGHGPAASYDLNAGKTAEQPENRLPPDAIRRVVWANHGRFKACYQAARVSNPQLAGSITTRFLIGPGGLVSSAQNLGTDISDSTMVQCVTRAFTSLAFPESPGGAPITVTYPLSFSPE